MVFLSLVKIFPPLLFLAIFAYVIFNVSYPNSLSEATFFQLTAFFVPLLFTLVFTINLFLNFFLHSIPISLGLIILLVLKGLGTLNIVTAILTILAIWLIVGNFKKVKQEKSRFGKLGSNPIKRRFTPPQAGLTSKINIPKLKSLQRSK